MQNKTITIIILLVIGGSLAMGLFLPKFQKYQSESLNVEMKETELEYQKNYASRLKEIDSQMESYEEPFSKIDSSLSDYFSIPAFFSNIQRMAAQSGLVIKSLSESSVEVKKESEDLKKRMFSISASGGYKEFKNFVSSIEKSAKIMEIESFGFSGLDEEESSDFNITISTHTY